VRTKIEYLIEVETGNSARHFIIEETGYLCQQGFRKVQRSVFFQILVIIF